MRRTVRLSFKGHHFCTSASCSKFSDNFPKVYEWKNQRNRPLEDTVGALSSEDKAKLSLKQIYHLEQLSLVDFSNQAAIERLSSAIRFANRLKDVDTTGVKPLFSLLENETLRLRPDEVTEPNLKDVVLKNAKVTMEDYFVAPPGNIPLEQQNKYEGNGAKSEPLSSVEMKKARKKG